MGKKILDFNDKQTYNENVHWRDSENMKTTMNSGNLSVTNILRAYAFRR